jgi:DNA repair exonuclease SbcCD nuclease subunit
LIGGYFVLNFGMYYEKIETHEIYAVGDTHGIQTFTSIVESIGFKDCVVIHVGDIGLGFSTTDDFYLNKLDTLCQEKNVKILGIRGNHDIPNMFRKESSQNKRLTNIELVEDYSYKTINDKIFVFAGGATSIDRRERVVGKSYWFDEVFRLPENLDDLTPADILISHSMPYECQPYGFNNIKYWLSGDPALKDELIKERKDISLLVEKTNVSQVWGGHFHRSISERIDNVYYRILDINEIVSITSYLQ